MKLLGPKSYNDLLKIFDEENKFKDAWYPPSEKDSWPRGRFAEANAQFSGEWYEYELSCADVLNIKLHWNDQFQIPQDGMTVEEALELPVVQQWKSELARSAGIAYAEKTHIWLTSKVLVGTSSEEQKRLKNHEGHLICLDGIHRLLAWANTKQSILAFVAGRPSNG